VHHHFTDERAYLWTMGHQWMAGASNNNDLMKLTREVWWLAGGAIESAEWDVTWPTIRALAKVPPAYPGPGWQAVFGDDLADRFAGGCWLSASDLALTPPALDELLDHFDERQRRTFAGGLTAVWLERDRQRIYLVSEDYREEGAQADWFLNADDAGALEQLARHVWRWGELHRTLEAGTQTGKDVLGRLRATHEAK
jgi:hypothetical protein